MVGVGERSRQQLQSPFLGEVPLVGSAGRWTPKASSVGWCMGVGVVPTVPFTCAQQYRSHTQKNLAMTVMFWERKELGGTKEGKAVGRVS